MGGVAVPPRPAVAKWEFCSGTAAPVIKFRGGFGTLREGACCGSIQSGALFVDVRDFIALDVETANADFGSICSIGLVHFRSGEVFKSLTILVDPEDEFDPLNIGIHGIRPEHVAGKPNIAKVLPVIGAALRDAIIVHHSPFDRTALGRAAGRYSTGGLPCIWLDTLQVARKTWHQFRGDGGYGLANLTRAFGIDFRHHDAAEDARAAGLLMLRAIGDGGISLQQWVDDVGYESTATSAPKRRIKPGYAGSHARQGISDGPLSGETILFTGTLQISRSEAAIHAASAGCDVVDSISKKVTILVVGDQDLRFTKGQAKSTKHRKAEDLIASGAPMRIVGESDFMLMTGAPIITDFIVASPMSDAPEVHSDGRIREFVISQTPEASRIELLVERVKQLKRAGDYSGALKFLNEEIDSQEQQSIANGWGVAPWYYEHAAIIYRKLNDRDAEIAVLERFAAQRHAPGVGPAELLARLQKARLRH